MSNIDLAIVVIAGLGAIQGLFKGLVLSITSLLGLVIGFYISVKFAWLMEGILRDATGSNSAFLHIIAFALCYLLVIILMYFIGKSVEKMLELASLGCLNRIGGAVFGILKGLLLVSAIIYVIEVADRNSIIVKPEKKAASLLYKPIAGLVPAIIPQVKKGFESIKKATPPDGS